jgi:peptidoglycan/xylan/chitin deacetylase (PgdA/CDA1 family)
MMHPLHRVVGRSIARAKTWARRGFDQQTGLLILCWHRFGRLGDGLSISPEQFVAQLDLLQSRRANILPLSLAVERLTSGNLPQRSVSLTFDDGYASVGEWAWPVLRERHLPATLFVVPGFFGEQMSFPWDQPSAETRLMRADDVRRVAGEGMDVQSHSLRHRWLPHGADTALLDDLITSKDLIASCIGRPVDGLAYPAGGWDGRVRRITRDAGYRYAVSVDRGVNPSRTQATHNLRRYVAPDTAAELDTVLDGGFGYLRTIERLMHRRSAAGLASLEW